MGLPKVLYRDQVKRLLAACPDTFLGRRDLAALTLMYRAGLRVAEVCNASLTDLDVRRARFFVQRGKGGKDRYIPLDPLTCRKIENWRSLRLRAPLKYQTNYLIVNRDGGQCSTRVFQLALQKLSETSGVYITDGTAQRTVHPHILRHCFATDLLEEGFNIREVQQMLGHSKLETTMIYTEVVMPQLAAKVAQRTW